MPLKKSTKIDETFGTGIMSFDCSKSHGAMLNEREAEASSAATVVASHSSVQAPPSASLPETPANSKVDVGNTSAGSGAGRGDGHASPSAIAIPSSGHSPAPAPAPPLALAQQQVP